MLAFFASSVALLGTVLGVGGPQSFAAHVGQANNPIPLTKITFQPISLSSPRCDSGVTGGMVSYGSPLAAHLLIGGHGRILSEAAKSARGSGVLLLQKSQLPNVLESSMDFAEDDGIGIAAILQAGTLQRNGRLVPKPTRDANYERATAILNRKEELQHAVSA